MDCSLNSSSFKEKQTKKSEKEGTRFKKKSLFSTHNNLMKH